MSDGKKYLLVVDDQINLLTTLKFIFEDSGFEVTMVSSGIQAIEKIKEINYDLALLDINMPEMDGLDTFREIKKTSPSTAVVMMTGNKENMQVKKCLEEGAITVVYKPFSVNKLIELMGEVMSRPVVLVVDDRRDDRVVLRNNLELNNFRVLEAKDGEDALEKVKRGNFDVCLVDFYMPGIDGLETIDKIKEINPEVGVILMSGSTLEDAVRSEISSNGGLAFLRKPYDINNLVEIIKEEMNEHEEKSAEKEEE
jgi:DNA-binding NtrC family response regulator